MMESAKKYNELKSLKTDKAKIKRLEDTPVDDPFWLLSYSANPLISYRVDIPKVDTFGSGVDPQVFSKMIRYVISGELSGDDLNKVVDTFAKTCTKDEWENWYKPILTRSLYLPVSSDIWNQHCPDEHHIDLFESIPELTNAVSDDTEVTIEPYDGYQRVIWVLENGNVRGFTPKGTEYHCPTADEFYQANTDVPSNALILFDTWVNDRTIMLRDVYEARTLLDGNLPPTSKRLAVLETLHAEYFHTSPNIELVEYITVPNSELATEVGLVLEQGTDEFILRTENKNEQALYSVTTSRKVKCVGIIEDENNPGNVSHLIAEPVSGKKKSQFRVRYGLKKFGIDILWNQRDTLLNSKMTVSYHELGKSQPVFVKLTEVST